MAMGMLTNMRVFISHRMIACDQASFLISYRFDHRLGFLRWWHLKLHLLTCHLCRNYARQMGELNQSMVIYRHQCSCESCAHRLSPEAGSRIGKALDEELNSN
jgi:hypothetical protein